MSDSGIVNDGRSRAVKAIEPSIRQEVESEYAEQLTSAGLVRRWIVKRRIKREVAKRIAKQAPKDGLYMNRT